MGTLILGVFGIRLLLLLIPHLLLSSCYTLVASQALEGKSGSSNVRPVVDTSASPSVIEGTARWFPGGGTVEMMYPSGYILTDLKWFTPNLFGANRIYLHMVHKPPWVNKPVRVWGKLRKDILTGSPSVYKFVIVTMKIDSLKVLE
jgi:hypothetical protein